VYEDIKWTGLESQVMKVIRAVGDCPDSGRDNYTAKTVRIARIIGDNGKQFRCVMPERADAPNHVLWRIIGRVNQIEWVDGKKTFPTQEKYPEIYNIVVKNSLSAKDPRRTYERGWEGRNVLIMNVIDRAQMDWHRENKHTMLLSRNIGVGKDGRVFPEEGVPSYGFATALADLFKYYKSWERYDIGIERTGVKTSPYKIINAGKLIEQVPASLQDSVSLDLLTDEEAGWERYDLSKLFAYTASTKIYNRLKDTIARIDAILGTKYLAELKQAADKEQAEWEAQKTATGNTPAAPQAEKPAPQAAPAARVATVRPISSPGTFDTTMLKGWDVLSAVDRNEVAGITVKNGAVTAVQYKDPTAALVGCPNCGVASPQAFASCPNCGTMFS
jgi:hypothetical protein